MADVPIKKNVARTIYLPGLVSQANTMLFQLTPMLAVGDFQYSIDGGTWTNLATTPDVFPTPGYQVRLQLAQAELNGDQINIRWSDAAGAQWCDGSLLILTTTNQTGDLATQANIGTAGAGLTAIPYPTITIPDSIAADGAMPTLTQAIYEILQFLTEKSVTSTTLTVKKPDGSTSLMTFTLDSATTPTAITRAS